LPAGKTGRACHWAFLADWRQSGIPVAPHIAALRERFEVALFGVWRPDHAEKLAKLVCAIGTTILAGACIVAGRATGWLVRSIRPAARQHRRPGMGGPPVHGRTFPWSVGVMIDLPKPRAIRIF